MRDGGQTMEDVTTTASLREVLAFPFRGPDWGRRFAIGSAIVIASFLVPVLPLIFVFGYTLAVMRQAIEGDALALPGWGEGGDMAIDGLRAMVAGLVFLLPGLLITFGGMALYFATTLAAPFAAQSGDEGWWLALFFGSLAVLFLSLFLGTVLTALGALPLPMAIAHLVAEDDLSAAFRVRQWWRLLRANALGVFIAWVVTAGLMTILYLAFVLSYYTLVLCCVAPLLAGPIAFYVMLVSAGLFGRTYRESREMASNEGTESHE
jgi:hypothetical protein